jgi:hypothetical protein
MLDSMTISLIALVVSVAGFLLSLWSAYSNRKHAQGQKLAELRAKAAKTRWTLYYRIKAFTDYVDTAKPFVSNADTESVELESTLRDQLRRIDELDDELWNMATRLPGRIFPLTSARLFEVEAFLDRTLQSAEASRAHIDKKITDLRKLIHDSRLAR